MQNIFRLLIFLISYVAMPRLKIT